MGFSSQAGHVLARTQAVPGVYQADTGAEGIGLKLRGGSLGPNRDLLIPDPEIGGGRDIVDANLGTVSWSGDYEFYARIDSMMTLLYGLLGSVNSAAVVDASTTHTFTPSDASQLPFLSIEEAVGAGFDVFRYTDVVVNSFHLEAEANGYLQGTAGLIARLQTAGNTRTATPDWDNGPMVVGSNISVTYNGVTLPAKSFSIDIANNFGDDDFRLGSFYIGDLTPKTREITASFGIRESSSALWRRAVYGSPVATAPGGLTGKAPLVITFNTYDLISGSALPYQGVITIPNYVLTPYALSISGDDIIENDIEGQGVRPNAATPIGTVALRSGRTDIA